MMAERAGARGRAPLLLKPGLPSAQGEERNRRKDLAGQQAPAGPDRRGPIFTGKSAPQSLMKRVSAATLFSRPDSPWRINSCAGPAQARTPDTKTPR